MVRTRCTLVVGLATVDSSKAPDGFEYDIQGPLVLIDGGFLSGTCFFWSVAAR